VSFTSSEREQLLVPVALPSAPETDWEAPSVTETKPAKKSGKKKAKEGKPEGDQDLSLAHPVLFHARSALIMVAILSIGLVVQLAWVSNWVHRSSQVSLFNRFRTELALGTGPIGATKKPLAIGAPMALIEIPSIGVNQVVVEGTTGAALTLGPGHLRSTVFPGGVGNSVIMGRAASYGGPFGRLHDLKKGAGITVVTQVGTSHFKVLGVRQAGGKSFTEPAMASHLTLETAAGSNYAPTGVVTVVAEGVGTPLAAQRPPVHVVPASQRPLGIDTSSLWTLLLWLTGLAVVLAAAVWTWHRRGHLQAWIVFGAPLALIWFYVADQVTRVLPNLL
jgi:LPXTG-site transpeptidase (sortase) family protein